MRQRYILAMVLMAILAIPAATWAQGRKMITREALVEMFESIGRDTKWDMSKPMLWGYFFTDAGRAKLEKAAPLLEKEGYRFVEIFISDKEDPNDPDLWWLHVEKVEVHTPDTLNKRNKGLYKFAADHQLGSYDGMDVGPVDRKD
ncbi:ribonuclease E inhibitor RraB [Steroidobacter cummioxidans]|uniref:ribonuclease E inhibitor RraB n=1 Tax=Steroidobacter cummioxidans TaxID=1803913 RepID=UPI0019D47426|nr:ribonuclease E inhibitor RraB [Steroidobacter cummioxidans]